VQVYLYSCLLIELLKTPIKEKLIAKNKNKSLSKLSHIAILNTLKRHSNMAKVAARVINKYKHPADKTK
jgi:hypothetical protein